MLQITMLIQIIGYSKCHQSNNKENTIHIFTISQVYRPHTHTKKMKLELHESLILQIHRGGNL